MADSQGMPDFSMDPSGLYREEVFTDQRTGTIRRMEPVTAAGEPDSQRPVRYVGETQVMTPAGSLPLSFELEGPSLEDAAGQFGDAAQKAVEEAMEELKRMQREASSQIVTPDGGMGGMGGMGGQGGPGGGLHMP